MIHPDFLNMIAAMPGVDAEAFEASMHEAPAVSIKLNRRKCTDPDMIGYGALESVRWCRSGYYLSERPKFTLNPLLHAGLFYVQDASSMIYETIVAGMAGKISPRHAPLVLDMCAAPGGKTTSMINALPDGSTVIANEVMPQRARILKENLLKWGYPDIMVTNSRSSAFAAMGEIFDIVAVDAPCSGEGMMRKDEDAVNQWSPRLVEQCAALQREILADAVEALKPGGILIYSTCTFNRHEDEENVAWLVENKDLEPIETDFPEEWGIGRASGSPYPALRFMPHLTRGEGLFAAVLRKPGELRDMNHGKILTAIRRKAKILADGIPTVNMKGKIEIPASEWALSTSFPAERYPSVELDTESALRYLRHESLILDNNTPKGFVVVKYKGHPLGFVKNIGNRANNLYPAEWRIRNL